MGIPRFKRVSAEDTTIVVYEDRQSLMSCHLDLRENSPPPDWGVIVDTEAVNSLAERLADHRFQPASYEYEGTPDFADEDWARFVVLGVAVVWRLWPHHGEPMWGAQLGDEFFEDASGIWTCFGREARSLDLDWIASGGLDASFFAGQGVLQDIPQRVRRLHEVARALLSRHGGSVLGMIEGAGGDAVRVRDVLVETIPGFFDRPISPAGTLCFDKLANLAVTMLAARLPITGIEQFPVFPDYMLPRHLRHEGVLVYADSLAAAVDTGTVLIAESRQEMAIRWATIRAAESLRRRLTELGNPVTTPELDYWLWFEAVLGTRAAEMGNHHLCITEAY